MAFIPLFLSFLHGHPSVYDVCSFIAIVTLFFACLGLNHSLKNITRRVALLERNDGQ